MSEATITTTEQLTNALARISFKNTVLDFNWQFEIRPVSLSNIISLKGESFKQPANDAWLVCVSFERPDTITGTIGRGRGREEVIWSGMTLSGVVKTAWLLVELMVRHELMEGFCFDGCRIFNPHNSVLDLAKLQEIHNQRTS